MIHRGKEYTYDSLQERQRVVIAGITEAQIVLTQRIGEVFEDGHRVSRDVLKKRRDAAVRRLADFKQERIEINRLLQMAFAERQRTTVPKTMHFNGDDIDPSNPVVLLACTTEILRKLADDDVEFSQSETRVIRAAEKFIYGHLEELNANAV